jgi:two-component system sensor histidine kinase KdpD
MSTAEHAMSFRRSLRHDSAPTNQRRRMTSARAIVLSALSLIACTLGMLAVRPMLAEVHVALILLLVVLGTSAGGGRVLGLASAAVAFIIFDVLFVPPYNTLVVANPLDWIVLLAFLATSVVAAQLLYRAEHVAALRETDRLKDALLASVSHDLRTPLTTIKAMAHELGSLGDERSEIIEQEADRLNRFVADLLDLSRLNAGALPLRVELNAADDLLGALVQRVEASLGRKRLAVTLPPGDALLLGRFDFVQALRALANLVENARKYDPSDAPIEITAERIGAELAIHVADRGPGVLAQDASRLFEPLPRPSGAPSAAGSAGLGLSIAKWVAEAQGGRLTYAARAGGGSVFTLFLPAVDDVGVAAELGSRASS